MISPEMTFEWIFHDFSIVDISMTSVEGKRVFVDVRFCLMICSLQKGTFQLIKNSYRFI